MVSIITQNRKVQQRQPPAPPGGIPDPFAAHPPPHSSHLRVASSRNPSQLPLLDLAIFSESLIIFLTVFSHLTQLFEKMLWHTQTHTHRQTHTRRFMATRLGLYQKSINDNNFKIKSIQLLPPTCVKFNDFEDIYGRQQGAKKRGTGAPFRVIVAACVASAISFAIIEYIAPPAGLGFEWNSRNGNGTGNWHLAWVSLRSGKDAFLL